MRYAQSIGLNIKSSVRAIKRFGWYFDRYRAFRGQLQEAGQSEAWPTAASFPCLLDAMESSGTASGAYFHQDLEVARRIFRRSPTVHVDVGSRVDGFVAHVATFRQITVLDIRVPPKQTIENITFKQCDLTQNDPDLLSMCDSLSCLHALEHFGLGRYGDPIDVNGHQKGLESLGRLVSARGMLYLSVPVGRQRIEFNAHRIFSPSTIIGLAKPWFRLNRFDFVDDNGDYVPVGEHNDEVERRVTALNYGCGIFELIRL